MAETSPISSSLQEPQVDENANSPVNTDHEDQTDAPAVKGLNESRTELFTRVQNLKKDLQEWRGKLDTQVKTYRESILLLSQMSLNHSVVSTKLYYLWANDLWASKLEKELGELRSTLNTEVEQLRVEFQELRNTLKKQLEITSGLARLEPDSLPSNNEHPATAL